MNPATAALTGRPFRVAPVLTAVVLTVLLLWLFGSIADVLILLFISILISLYLGAVAEFLMRWTRLPRHLAFFSSLLITAGAVIGLLFLLVPPVIEQTQALITNLPDYVQTWEARLAYQFRNLPGFSAQFQPGNNTLMTLAYAQAAEFFGGLLPRVMSLFHAAISFFSVLIMSIYLGLTPGVYREWLIALFPPLHRDLVRDLLADLGTTLRAWIVGQLLGMTILAVLTAIGLYMLDVPYWLTFGIFTGAVSIVPFFGTLVSTLVPAIFVLGGPGGETRALLVVLLGVVIHMIESNLLMPRIMEKQVELPPVLSILIVLVFAKLLGGAGLLVAVPALASLMVVVRRILISRIYEGQGFRRASRDRILVLRVPVPRGGVTVPNGAPPDVIAFAERATPHLKTA